MSYGSLSLYAFLGKIGFLDLWNCGFAGVKCNEIRERELIDLDSHFDVVSLGSFILISKCNFGVRLGIPNFDILN